MKKIIKLLILILILTPNKDIYSQDDKKSAKTDAKTKTKSFASIVSEATKDEGLFNVYLKDDKYYYEIPDSLIGRDMLMITRVSKMSVSIPLYSHILNRQVLRWEKNNNNILLRESSYVNFAADSLPINEAVINSNFEPILFKFKIEAKNDSLNSSLINVTNLFTTDLKSIGYPQRSRKTYKITSLDSKLSYIENIKSFPKNIEVRNVKTYRSTETENGSVSMEINNSMIVLPKKPMKRRYFDERVGWNTNRQVDYGLDNQKAETVRYLRRWRLEVKEEDIEKFKAGELVEPKNPIVFYIDPATPVKWRKYIKLGIEDWQIAFEEAGFKNAILAKDPPTEEKNPDWSPEDVRYSVFRYLASETINANGGNVVDPRSGEIIEFSVNWYHNVLKLVRDWLVVQTAAVNPDARGIELKNELMGEGVRFIAAHEVGHAIGLPHNMGSSSAYPVDSLRSATFTKKYGTAPSIMDYARYNYVAQPEDKGVALIPSDWDTPNNGIYDRFSVKWGYKPILGASQDEEKEILRKWIIENQDDPKYRFGPGRSIDPSQQTEDLGDNAIEASNYGIKNLKRIYPELINWTSIDGENYDNLRELHNAVFSQFRRYMGHVATNVGGVYQYYKTSDQEGAVYTHVEKSHQKNCIKFLNKNLFETPTWMIDKNILDKIQFAGAVDQVRGLQSSYLNRILDFGRLARVIENEALNGSEAYSLDELMSDLKNGIFSELNDNSNIDIFRRNIQRAFIQRLGYLMKENQSIPSFFRSSSSITRVKVDESDIRSSTLGVLIDLRRELNKAQKKYSSNKSVKNHLMYCTGLINNILKG
jgi:hypothetical protein|tara:strand:- start:167 stop:2617 length:2451 start_codon:yes stop_codon:yes gene_type:complete